MPQQCIHHCHSIVYLLCLCLCLCASPLPCDKPTRVEQLPRHIVDVPEPVGPELNAAVPPANNDNDVCRTDELEQVRKAAAGSVLAVVVIVVQRRVCRGERDAVRENVVCRAENATVR